MSQPPVSAIEHYQILLASHYTWMSGDFATKVDQQQALFTRLGVAPAATAEAVDLGCGSGFQSIALARLGFSVTAIDTNAQLLAELDQHAEGLPIRTVQHDLSDLASCSALPSKADYAVCMGDTLSHLPSSAAVTSLFIQVSHLLAPGGWLVLGFRDLSQGLHGLDRFIPIRGDAERIMTCFLEYEKDTVIVNDLIYLRHGQGWNLHKSAYRKLRLSSAWVRSELATHGFQLHSEEQTLGMTTIVAQKQSETQSKP